MQDRTIETLWQFMERGILSDGNRHDALVYFGRRISRPGQEFSA